MILSHRKAHFWSAIALACLLPLLFSIGLIFRPDYPFTRLEIQPNISRPPYADHSAFTWQTGSLQLKTRLHQTTLEGVSPILLEISPLKPIKIPDPLLYWQIGTEKPTKITEDMVLLGSLRGTSPQYFPLPPQAIQQKGQLILFSQGYKQIIAVFPLSTPN